MQDDHYLEIMKGLSRLESDMSTLRELYRLQNERINKMEEQHRQDISNLEEKIDQLIENERSIFEIINESDEKLDEKIQKFQLLLLRGMGAIGLSLLMYILQYIINVRK